MKSNLDLFNYIHIDNKSPKTLFLLHGTGGTENDFFFLNEHLHRTYNLVGLKGNVDEHGMTRFFKRLGPNVFDQESIKKETQNLKLFIDAWINDHKTLPEHMYFLGYSNGANMLLATLFRFPTVLKNLILLHPMLPYSIKEHSLDLSAHKVFISIGNSDQMIPPEEGRKVIDTLISQGALPIVKEYPSGHEITNQELEDVISFLA